MITNIIKTKCPLCQRQYVYMPCDKRDREIFEKKKPNIANRCDIREPRNLDHHRLIFGLAHLCLENMSELSFWNKYYMKNQYIAEKNFIKAVMNEHGIYDIVPNMDGSFRKDVKSISFGNMDEFEFQMVSDAMFEITSTILGLDPDWLKENYEEIFKSA